MMWFHCQRDVLSVEQEIVSKEFSEQYGPDIFDDSEETEIRLPFP